MPRYEILYFILLFVTYSPNSAVPYLWQAVYEPVGALLEQLLQQIGSFLRPFQRTHLH